LHCRTIAAGAVAHTAAAAAVKADFIARPQCARLDFCCYLHCRHLPKYTGVLSRKRVLVAPVGSHQGPLLRRTLLRRYSLSLRYDSLAATRLLVPFRLLMTWCPVASFQNDKQTNHSPHRSGSSGGGGTVNMLPDSMQYRQMKARYHQRTSVRNSPIHSLGLFANDGFAAQEMVIEYTGTLCSPAMPASPS
jgi:hypothetical protein